MASKAHVTVLERGVREWNQWREQHPRVRPDLRRARLSHLNLTDANLADADLTSADLESANLQYAFLDDAKLSGARLVRAKLVETNFVRADLSHADLTAVSVNGANFRDANLHAAILAESNLGAASFIAADLSRATLRGANLSFCRFVDVDLRGADLTSCEVYGVSVWNSRLAGALQRDLVITRAGEPTITVDDIEVAQFVHLLLNNAKLRSVIDTVTAKAVLLLGRFTPGRKAVLHAMHSELRRRGYLPILFDFARPTRRSLTETVLTLAGMARFVIADLTDFSSVPQELTAIALSALTSVPVQPVLLRGSDVWTMYPDLQLKGRFLAPYEYDTPDQLVAALPEHVVGPAAQEADSRRTQLAQLYAEAAARRRRPRS